MPELNVQIGVKSDLLQAVRDINAVRTAIEQTRAEAQRTAQVRRESAQLDAQERDRAFAKLPVEQQLAALETRKAELKRRIDQPGIPRSEPVQIAFQNALKRTEGQITSLQDQSALETQAKLNSLRQESARLTDTEQKRAFDRLSTEEQIVALEARRTELQRQLAQPVKRDEAGTLGLQNDLRRTEAQLGTLRDEQAARRQGKLNSLRTEAAKIAAEERRKALERVPVEERINRLLAQRDRLNRFLGRTGLSDVRQAALQLRLRQTQSRLGDLRQANSFTGALKQAAMDIPFVGRAISFLEGPIGKLGLRVAGTAGAIAVMTYGLFKAARAAQHIADTSASTQIGTTRLQALAFAAQATGADFESLTRANMDLRKNTGDALDGNKEMIDAFRTLGITMEDLANLSTDELFLRITQSIQDGHVSAQKFNAILQVMGRGGRALMSALQKDLGGLVDAFEQSGLAIDKGALNVLERFGDDFDRMAAYAKAGIKKLFVELAGGAVTLGQLSTAAVANVFAPFSGTARELRDDLLTQRALAQAGGDDNDTIRKMEDKLTGKQAAKKATQAKTEKDRQDFSDNASKKAERLLQLQQEERRLQFNLLDADEKRVQLLEERERLLRMIAILEAEGGDNAEEIQREKNRLLEIQGEVENLDKTDHRAPTKPNVDSLHRIGGFRGGRDGAQGIESGLKALRTELRALNRRVDRPLNARLVE